MTGFFLLTLIASVGITIALAIIVIHRLQVNWTSQNKRGISFLIPVVVVILLCFMITLDTFPRLLDTINIVQNNVKVLQINSANMVVRNNRIIVDDQVYILPMNHELIEENTNYSFTYLPNTKIIIQQEKVETLPNDETLIPVIEEEIDPTFTEIDSPENNSETSESME